MASILIPNKTRDLVYSRDLNILIASGNNNSTFKAGEKLYLRASNGASTQEKVFNEMAAEEDLDSAEWQIDENEDYFAIIEKISTFQVSIYNLENKQYDIFINNLYLTTAEQKAFISEQGMTEDEFLTKYGKESVYHGYLIKFEL